MKAEEVFANELQMIQSLDISNFVLQCFNKLCPNYFWTVPCSTTGKYHPKISLGVGGLVRHTKLAVWWGLELIRALGSSPGLKNISTVQLQDEVIAALLVHDMIKNGEGLDSDGRPLDRSVTGTHGVTLAAMIFDTGYETTISGWGERIYYGIAGHMGIWTTNIKFRPNELVNPTLKVFADLIHLADYCASRKVDGKISELNREKE